jgi:hypothetical protein
MNKERFETAEYIETLAYDLATLARRAGLELAAFLLDMAAVEATKHMHLNDEQRMARYDEKH